MQLNDGDADVAICTPAGILSQVVTGEGLFKKAMPHLRALGTLPQNDRMVLAVDPKYKVQSYEDLRKLKPALRIATSTNDGTNMIGYVADKFLAAHELSRETIESWGGSVLTAHRPEQCVARVERGEADALLQEAIMTLWWRRLIDSGKLVPLPAEPQALEVLQQSTGLGRNSLPKGYWESLTEELPALDFSDFVILVRDDMPKEVAYLLTWCLVETRHMLEGQYKHIPPQRSPLSYPLDPAKMAQTPISLHEGAQEYYSERDAPGRRERTNVGVSPF